MGTPFQLEVVRVAAVAGVTPPVVIPRPDFQGGAGLGPSGRWIRVGAQVLAGPAPVQRWFAAHEMGHLVLGHHGWADLSRWAGVVAGLALLGLPITAWPSTQPVQLVLPVPAPMMYRLVIAVVIFGLAFLVGSLMWCWWSRKLEAQADRYARPAGSAGRARRGQPDVPDEWRG